MQRAVGGNAAEQVPSSAPAAIVVRFAAPGAFHAWRLLPGVSRLARPAALVPSADRPGQGVEQEGVVHRLREHAEHVVRQRLAKQVARQVVGDQDRRRHPLDRAALTSRPGWRPATERPQAELKLFRTHN